MASTASVCSVGSTATRGRRPRSPPSWFHPGEVHPVAKSPKALLPPPPPKVKATKHPTSPTTASFGGKAKTSHWPDLIPLRHKKKKSKKDSSRPHTSAGVTSAPFDFAPPTPQSAQVVQMPRKISSPDMSIISNGSVSDFSEFDDLSFNPVNLPPPPRRPSTSPLPTKPLSDPNLGFVRDPPTKPPGAVKRKPVPIVVNAVTIPRAPPSPSLGSPVSSVSSTSYISDSSHILKHYTLPVFEDGQKTPTLGLGATSLSPAPSHFRSSSQAKRTSSGPRRSARSPTRGSTSPRIMTRPLIKLVESEITSPTSHYHSSSSPSPASASPDELVYPVNFRHVGPNPTINSGLLGIRMTGGQKPDVRRGYSGEWEHDGMADVIARLRTLR